MADGFLGRWSQRKQALREGRVLEDVPPLNPPPTVANPAGIAVRHHAAAPATTSPESTNFEPGSGPLAGAPTQSAPAPTLEDVKALNADSSFAPFVSRDVAPEVRNAAMKKLFTDPHYNVMDRLDIYIEDYSMADPMPVGMLQKMASAKFLNLFDEDPPASAQVMPDPPGALPLGSLPPPPLDVGTLIEDTSYDHTDLRLQPDHAARPTGAGCLPERTTDAAFEPMPPRGS